MTNAKRIKSNTSSTKPKIYYKITNHIENHHGFQYKTGLNILKGNFADISEGECAKPGLYYTDLENIHKYYYYGCHVREVIIPKDAKVVNFHDKSRTNKLILRKKYDLYSADTLKKLKLRITCSYIRNFISHALYSVNTSQEEPFTRILKFFTDNNKKITDNMLLTVYMYNNIIYDDLIKSKVFTKYKLNNFWAETHSRGFRLDLKDKIKKYY